MLRSAVSVVIPAYNEEKTIGEVIEETTCVMDSLQVPYEIIIVDDGSSDRTRQIAATHKVTVLANGKNRGKGYAMRKAFQQVHGDIVITLDADGAHSPKEIPSLMTPLFNGTDIVAGSRFLGTGANSTSKLNRVGNFILNMVISTLTGRIVTDSQTGFRAVKKEVLQKLDLVSCGFEIETEITMKSLKNGFIFEEKPISCRGRAHNASKLRIVTDGSKIFKMIFKANLANIETNARHTR